MANHQIEQQIVNFLQNHKKESFSVEELSQKLSLNKSKDFKLFVKAVASLERDKIIVLTKKGKIKLPQLDILIDGTYRANERGFGFVTIDAEEDDVFIPKEKTNFALDGDKVTIDILRPQNILESKGAEGRVVEVVERHQTQLVGEFVIYDATLQQETDLLGELVPKDKKLSNYRVYVAPEGLHPVDCSICILEITHYPEEGYPTSIEGVVKQIVGHKDDPGMDILSIVIEHGIPTDFSIESLEQANNVPEQVSEKEIAARRDLRDEVIVTIDGADAKDLDDAVSVKRLANGNYHLGVHIADVSYYVTENSPLDKEAYERGTSVYLTDRVIPMIPKRLSNGICSLNPKVPRLTMSCEMEIDTNGHVVNYDMFESVIQTTERMTYNDVNLILMDKDDDIREQYSSLVPMFETMAELHHILETMREKRGAISFEDHEAYIAVDESGHPEEIILRERGIGERLIESFMLAANETVATHFETKKLPFIYRIHESPNEEKLQRFFEFVSTFGLQIKGTKSTITPSELQDALDKVKGKPEEGAVNTMLLRSMQQAVYSADNVGHYGLASETYTHFTSPIRRYPDLIVHRLIRSYQSSKNANQTAEKWEESLPNIAQHSSEMERRAVNAERDTDSLKKAEFMADKVGEVFEGVISSVTKFGFFVELDNTVEGLVHVNSLKQDYFQYVDNRLTLVGEHSGITYRIGDTVKVKVTKSDPETREIDFEIEMSEDELKMVEERAKLKKTRSQNGRKRGEKKQPGFRTPKGSKDKKGKKPFYKAAMKKKKGNKKGHK